MPGNVIFSGCDDAISVQNCVYCSQGEKKKKPNLDGKKKPHSVELSPCAEANRFCVIGC